MEKQEIISHQQKYISSNHLFSNLSSKTIKYFHEIFDKNAWERSPVISTRTVLYSVEISEIHSDAFLAKISWK